jgi:2-polyprenyl-3-methyl-5-hydroxy-6-metoxy-1,4-benzoquinol methylase
MPFYPSIRPWYDQIFPFIPAQLDFVLSFGADPGLSVLDVGCGTGSLIVALADIFRSTAGMDPDEDMLESARLKASAKPVGTWFSKAGMLDLNIELAPESVNRLLCFGNTLPHLANEEEVVDFIHQAFHVIKPNGLIMMQIINYDRILDQKLDGLPTIGNDECQFERRYQYQQNSTHIQFQTKLTIRRTGQIIENSVPLLAIRPARLRQILADSGFSEIEEFGSFKKDPLTSESQAYIVKAMKY